MRIGLLIRIHEISPATEPSPTPPRPEPLEPPEPEPRPVGPLAPEEVGVKELET